MSTCRYYQTAGLTLQVEAELAITDSTFDGKFRHFEIPGPGDDTVFIRHHFSLPNSSVIRLGKCVYDQPQWKIYQNGDSWIYMRFPLVNADEGKACDLAIVSDDHTIAQVYHDRADMFLKGGAHSLTLLNTDEILLARVLVDRKGCYLHSSGGIMNGNGLLFLGHSGAGKSTILEILGRQIEVLGDDRNIVRLCPDGFRVHGAWGSGEGTGLSGGSAPLRAVLFLRQATKNRLQAVDNRRETLRRLLACTIKHHATSYWWNTTLDLLETIACDVPSYYLDFDKSGGVTDTLQELL